MRYAVDGFGRIGFCTTLDPVAKIIPAIKFSLEEALEYIQKDEYVEVTPKSIRMRKIYLDETERKRMSAKLEAQ